MLVRTIAYHFVLCALGVGGGETTERAVDSLTHVSIEWSRWESSGGPESRRQAGRAPRDSMPSREWHTK